MLERLTKVLKDFGYEHDVVKSEFNTKVMISRTITVDNQTVFKRIVIIICDNGMIVKDGEDYCIVHTPYDVIDILDCIL